MKRNNKKGFTIVELVIVIAVIGILAAVLIPTFSNVIEKANASAALQAAKNAQTEAMVEFYADGELVNYNAGTACSIEECTHTGEGKKEGCTYVAPSGDRYEDEATGLVFVVVDGKVTLEAGHNTYNGYTVSLNEDGTIKVTK